MKADDTGVVPENLTAPWLKRFFQRRLGIPIRVEGANRKGWVHLWIMSDRAYTRELIYHHRIPPELGQRCMAIVYEGHDGLSKQAYGGNIMSNGIAMHGHELRRLLQGLIDRPLSQEALDAVHVNPVLPAKPAAVPVSS